MDLAGSFYQQAQAQAIYESLASEIGPSDRIIFDTAVTRLRCRNIKKLFYYSESKSKDAEYESLDELITMYTSYIIQSEKLKDVCEVLDDEYNVVLNEDKFF